MNLKITIPLVVLLLSILLVPLAASYETNELTEEERVGELPTHLVAYVTIVGITIVTLLAFWLLSQYINERLEKKEPKIKMETEIEDW